MAAASAESVVRFEPVSGPELSPLAVAVDRVVVLGRSPSSDFVLGHETVSRRHAEVDSRGGVWSVTDLGSRHGTYLNSVRLTPERGSPVRGGDLVRIGPWTFRVVDQRRASTSVLTTNDVGSTVHRVESISGVELEQIAQKRLDLILRCAASVNAARDEVGLASRVLEALAEGTGFPRAAFIRPTDAGTQIDVVAAFDQGLGVMESGATPHIGFSRSLIAAAARGELVRLTDEMGGLRAESIVRSGVQAALCAPVMLDGAPAAYLYLDARTPAARVREDAPAFCLAVSQMCALALANLKRRELEERERKLDWEMDTAREAQRMILPPEEAQVCGVRYAMRMIPGRQVAGDLFGVVPLAGDRTAVFIGDVEGKGLGAGVVMTATQTFLSLHLRHETDPGRVLTELNSYLESRSQRLVTLWLGVFEKASGVLRCADAGHGNVMSRCFGEAVDKAEGTGSSAGSASGAGTEGRSGQAGGAGWTALACRGGPPLRTSPGYVYPTETVALAQDGRIVLFSDGLAEQVSPEGEQFGVARVSGCLRTGASEREDVEALIAALAGFAGRDAFNDDVTVASVGW